MEAEFLQVDYRRDLYSNSLILSEEQQPDLSSYQVRMLMANELKGFLHCNVHQMDGRLLFYYDITSRQSMETLFEHQKISGKTLRLILSGLVDGLDTVRSFLLNMDGLLLNPRFIYMNAEKSGIWFCYLPGYSVSLGKQLREFSEFLLPRLDNQDRESVVMGYAFYQLTVREEITAEEIRALLHLPVEERPGRKRTPDPAPEAADRYEEEQAEREKVPGSREELLNAFFSDDEEEEEEKKDWKKIAVVAGTAAAAAAAGGLAALAGGAAAGFAAACLAAAAVLLPCSLRIFRNRKEDRSGQQDGPQLQAEPAPESEIFPENILQMQEEREDRTVCLTGENIRQKGCLMPLSPGGLEPVRLEGEVLLIGKSRQSADIVLNSPAVSRIHARMVWDGAAYRLSDLNSRNGTWVNHNLLEPEKAEILKDGDEIRFADLTYLYRK